MYRDEIHLANKYVVHAVRGDDIIIDLELFRVACLLSIYRPSGKDPSKIYIILMPHMVVCMRAMVSGIPDVQTYLMDKRESDSH